MIRKLLTFDSNAIYSYIQIFTSMGALSSMCCQAEKSSNINKEAIPTATRQKVNIKPPLTEEKKEKKNQAISFRPPQPIEAPTKDNKNEKQAEDELIKILQSKFPLPNDKKSIKWENFQVTHRIGSGGFGQVFLGELTENKSKGIQEKYAIKRIPKAEILKRKLTANIKLQKKILHESKCNFITTLHYAFRDAKYLYLVMEWAQGGDTYSLINQKSNRLEDFKKSGQKAVRFILACLILGMEYLHSKNIMYRDLKPQNVLIFQNGYAKLTDFGLAKEIKEQELSKTQAGTTIYYAPEMVLRQGYGKQIDLWTIGIFAYEMSNYCPPFSGPEIKDKQRVKRLVKAAQSHRTWKNLQVGEQLRDFINSLLKFDPKERLGYKSWNEIKSHKFFTCVNFDWQALEEMKMQSPLKAIVDKHKSRYKNYVPQNKGAVEANSKSDEDWSGWTFKNNCQV